MSSHPYDEKTIARFWAKVNKNGPVPPHRPELGPCWVWSASKRAGYGAMSGNIYAHQLSFTIHHGPVPVGKEVCHHCDNRACVNPCHMFAGTRKENVADAVSKNRHSHPPVNRWVGEEHPGSKLTAANVVAIRALIGTQSQSSIAAQFGVSQMIVSRIARRLIWTHVP